MATPTKQEREYETGLRQEQLQTKQNSKKSQGITPETVINFGEMVIILGAAITVDAIDILDLTGFGAILVRFIDIPTLGALWLWRISKGESKKNPTFLILTTFLVELSPVGMIPAWTIFVAYVYFQDNKLAKTAIGGAMRTRQISKAIRRKIKK